MKASSSLPRSSSRRWAVVGSAICVAMIAASPITAHATMYLKVSPYSGTQAETFSYCGLDVEFTEAYEGRISIRAGTGDLEGEFFVHDNFSYVQTWTNATPGSDGEGKFFAISAHYTYQDVRATHVEGSIFEVVSHVVGQQYVIRDMNGDLVLRDRGALTYTYLFDTLGDAFPGGISIEDLDFRVSGPHLLLDDDAFCAMVVSLIG